ncbi:MAG: hypothetical protein H8D23_11670 [Candidatus Brocadiales bacterium]|nr:hypothetical protein [Candidatus Brocadiales bacterium]
MSNELEQDLKDYIEQPASNYEDIAPPQPLAGFIKIAYCRECGVTGPEDDLGKECENCGDDTMIQAVHRGDGQSF